MTISIYQASVLPFIRGLESLANILDKAERHAAERKIDPSVLLSSRLYPDMYPLMKQVQRATQVAAGCASRLTGKERERDDDTETTFPQLIARIRQTIGYLKGLTRDQLEGSEERKVTLTGEGTTYNFSGLDYLFNLALPNFYFHITTAYDICRHCGVELGKQDYIGKL